MIEAILIIGMLLIFLIAIYLLIRLGKDVDKGFHDINDDYFI